MPNGSVLSGAEAMESIGVRPLKLEPRDGLALASHSSFSVAAAAMGLYKTISCLDRVQIATAMTMEAFRANLSPLDSFAQTVNPQPGLAEAAEQLSDLLRGSVLFDPAKARRLQDPLSIRNAVQVHGALISALNFAIDTVEVEMNASSDNPVVDVARHTIISCGAYHTPHLTIAVETVSRAT